MAQAAGGRVILSGANGSETKLPIDPEPHNIEAEEALLGALVIDPGGNWAKVRSLVEPDDFYRHSHRCIFRAIAVLGESSEPLDAITLGHELRRQGTVEQAGGYSYIAGLANDVPYVWHPEAWAKIVHDLALRRRVIDEANRMAAQALNPQAPGLEAVEAWKTAGRGLQGPSRRLEGLDLKPKNQP